MASLLRGNLTMILVRAVQASPSPQGVRTFANRPPAPNSAVLPFQQSHYHNWSRTLNHPLVLYAMILSIASVFGLRFLMESLHGSGSGQLTATSAYVDGRLVSIAEQQAPMQSAQMINLSPRQEYFTLDRAMRLDAQPRTRTQEPWLKAPGSRNTEPIAAIP